MCFGDDLERRNLDLESAQFDALVVCELSRDPNERPGIESSDEFRQREAFGRIGDFGVDFANGFRDELNSAGLVTQNDELNGFLVANGVDPPRDNDVAIGESGKGRNG